MKLSRAEQRMRDDGRMQYAGVIPEPEGMDPHEMHARQAAVRIQAEFLAEAMWPGAWKECGARLTDPVKPMPTYIEPDPKVVSLYVLGFERIGDA